MAQTQYLDKAGLEVLVTNIKNADKSILDKIGTVPAKVGETDTTTVVAYVDAKAAAAVAAASADNTAMDTRMDAVETAVETLTGADTVAGSVAKAVKDEADRAKAAEKALADDLGKASVPAAEGQSAAAATGLHADVEKNASDIAALQTAIGSSDAEGSLVDRLATVEESLAEGGETAEAISALQGLVGETSVATQIANATDANSDLGKAVAANTTAITKLNAGSTEEGSVAYQIAQIVNENNNGSIDTLNEIAAWIVSDSTGAAKMAKDIGDNASAISALQTAVGAPAAGETAATGLFKALEDLEAGKVADADHADAADEATKATQDGDGNVISTTYVKAADIASIPTTDIDNLFK